MESPLKGLNDTIVAISTPMNRSGGGIGIVRLSGNNSFSISTRLFRPIKKEIRTENRQFVLGHIIDPLDRQTVDEAFFVFMKAPRTYTREDVVEFHCHGGARIVHHVLELVVTQGARIARPGEFTLRAFLNGRIDLTQAEAVLDLIQAKSNAGLRIAAQQLAGSIEKKIKEFLSELTDLETSTEAQIDFPEEEIIRTDAKELRSAFLRISDEIEKLISTFEQGKKIINGFRVTIAGLPNVGKSSLMNCLLQRNRSIVSPIPGTTRDYIEEIIELDGIPVQLTDTAGIKTSRNIIEKESVNRSTELIRQSDLVALVLDSSKKMSVRDEQNILTAVKDRCLLIVLNKEDIRKIDHQIWARRHFPNTPICTTSAINGTGVNELSLLIAQTLSNLDPDPKDELILTNARHAEALERAANALKRLEKLIENSALPLTLIVVDMNEAIAALREILGIEINESILDRIFQKFCIGK
jgi:tRNA modification GTPase